MAKSNALKWVLFGFNAIILVAGVAIVAASLRLLFDPDFSYLLFQHGSYMAGYILLALGALMSIVALFGLASVLIERPCLLWAFFILLLLFVVGEVAGGVLAYTQKAGYQERIELSIRWSVQRYYSQEVTNTTAIDAIQQGWQCCGSNSYTSWSNSEYSKRNIPLDTSPTSTYWVPESCCVDKQSERCHHFSVEGLRGPDSEHVYHKEGCGHKLVSIINTYSRYMFGFGALLVLIQLVTMTLTGVFIHSLTSSGNSFLRSSSRYGSGASEAMLR